MPWYSALGIGRRRLSEAHLAAQTTAFASAQIPAPDRSLLPRVESWQEEAWGYYDSLSEAGYAADWLASMLSRVRLRAAQMKPGRDEPSIVDTGPAAEILSELGGGVPGQAQIMASLAVQLSVPGEGFLIGERVGRRETWSVRSIDEIRVSKGVYEVVDGRLPSVIWRPLSPDSLVTRVWKPHARYYHMADSAFRSARPAMRELELVNRYITGQYLSRLASAGVVVFPDEITFPVREEFEDSVDPFMSEWIEIAAQAIKEPGTASAVIPIPIRVPAEYVDKIQHLDFTLKIDEKIIDKRDAAIKRVATRVNVPAEVLLGMGDVNHWGAWQLEEGALKTNIAPVAELICQALTTGYLQPRLRASGVDDTSQWVVWYDMSELALRPDRSGNAFNAYDRLEISGSALRRETGFDEDDKPTDEDLREQALKVIIKTLPSGAASALAQLIGEEVAPVVPISPQSPEEAEQAGAPTEAPAQSPPSPPEEDVSARRIEQAKAMHVLRADAFGEWELLHPPLCKDHLYTCPVTFSSRYLKGLDIRPGTKGLYELRLSTTGIAQIGKRLPLLDTSKYVATRSVARV